MIILQGIVLTIIIASIINDIKNNSNEQKRL